MNPIHYNRGQFVKLTPATFKIIENVVEEPIEGAFL